MAKDIISQKLDKISSTFCMSKWYKPVLRLDLGYSYSCHHCPPQKIDKEKIKKDPKFLTNVEQVIEDRQGMLEGKQVKDCSYCWLAEKNNIVSDRIKSSTEFIGMFDNFNGELITTPTSLEVSFDSTCNLKCAYCGPKFSTSWEQEYKTYGPFPTKTKRQDLNYNRILNRETNPYIDAFWQWWPELSKNLKTLRITGGEPLLSKNTYKVLEKIYEENLDIRVAINSNLSVDITRLLDILVLYNFNEFVLHVSLEADKDRSEYSRFGLDYDLFVSNVDRYLSKTNYRLNFSLTNNMLNITGYVEFLNYFFKLKKEWGNRVSFSSNQLTYPAYLDIRILDDENKNRVKTDIQNFIDNHTLNKFEIDSISKPFRYLDFPIENKDILRNDFINYVLELDRRRDTKFIKTYPEFEKLLTDWKLNE